MFSYRAIELPDSDATAANMRAQHWESAISFWNRTQYGTAAAYNVTVFGFIDFNTSWTLTSLTSPLPIELLHFSAEARKDHVRLAWSTSSEINNDYFTIEKSADGRLWAEMGKVEGAHNSTTLREYMLDDREPLEGISYYRLKQTDYDGQFTYSDPVPVVYKGNLTSFTVFPNPASDKAFLSGPGHRATIQIYDMSGAICRKFESEGQIHEVDLENLPDGIYTVQVLSETDSEYIRLVKN
jgi:hypothetical protein